jgi:hypothetical protein
MSVWLNFERTSCFQLDIDNKKILTRNEHDLPKQGTRANISIQHNIHNRGGVIGKKQGTANQEPIVRMDIMCRTFHGALFEILRMIFTYLLFFPVDKLSPGIVLVLDAEDALDHAMGSLLETAYKHIHLKAVYENPPPPGTLTARMRSEGFSRTQWSNFYSDLYSDAEFIGIIDSDVEFFFKPIPEKHLLLKWKTPVIHGILSDPRLLQCVKFMIGRDAVAEFMYVFPFIVKHKHFALMREHIMQTTGYNSFEQAWFEMQIRFDTWGQFLVMGNYLFHFHHDEYVWHIVGQKNGIGVFPYVAKHLPMNQDTNLTIRKYWHQTCVQHKQIGGKCSDMTAEEVNLAKFVPFTDYWPMPEGVDGHNMRNAFSSGHDSTAPRPHAEVFDEIINEIYLEEHNNISDVPASIRSASV